MMPEKQMRKKLGEIMVDAGIISGDQLRRALDLQKQEGGLVGEILIRMGFLSEQQIVQALTTQYGFPYLPLENYEFNKEGAKVVPENVARQYSILPVDVMGTLLIVAMSNPLNERAIEDVEMITKKKVKIFISTVTEIHEGINRLYKEAGD